MTLLEVILAVALTVGIVGSIMGFYDHALKVRDSLEHRARQIEAARLVMNLMTNELRSAMSYEFLQMGVEGQADEIRFISASVPGPAAWALRKPTEEPIPPEQDVQIIGYRLRIVEDDQTGQPVPAGLERTWQKLLTARQAEEGREIQTDLLTEEIAYLHLRYWQDGQWSESWTGGDLPQAVEITLGTEPLPAGMAPADYPYAVLRRVVYLPGSRSAAREGGTGPLGEGIGPGRGDQP